MKATNFPALIQRFFTDRLCTQMEASRHTVAGYRDTFRLLIRYARERNPVILKHSLHERNSWRIRLGEVAE
jgi:hypothetical protein